MDRKGSKARSSSTMLRLLIIILLLACVRTAPAEDWPEFRGPRRDGLSRETNWTARWPADGPKMVWSAKIGAGFASVSIARGRLFAIGNVEDHDIVRCLDVADGREVWRFAFPSPLAPKYYPGGPSATPTVAGSRVFTLSKSGLLHCLAATDGTVIWKKDLVADFGLKAPDWGFASSVRIEGETLFLNAGLSGLALRTDTGEAVWKSAAGPGAYASAVALTVAGDRQIAVLGKDTLFGVSAADGAVRWSFPWATSFGENIPDPVPVGDHRLLVASGHGMGSALLEPKRDSVSVVWTNREFGPHLATAVLHEGHLYGFSGVIHRAHADGLKCVEAATGQIRWSVPNLRGSLLIANGTILALTLDGELIAASASPEKYTEFNRAQVLGGKCWTAPVLSHGRLYVRNATGDLACFDLSAR